MKDAFTLVELLVSMAIVAIIFLVGFILLSGTQAVQHRTLFRLHCATDHRLFMSVLARDIEGAYPRSNPLWDAVFDARAMITTASDNNDIDHTVLQFWTNSDCNPRGHSPDAFVFVRYYTNETGDLCRDIQHIDDPDISPEPVDLTDEDPAMLAPASGNKLFLIARAKQWDSVTHSLRPQSDKETVPLDISPTHISVSLQSVPLPVGGDDVYTTTVTFVLPECFSH